jgi:serralysin
MAGTAYVTYFDGTPTNGTNPLIDSLVGGGKWADSDGLPSSGGPVTISAVRLNVSSDDSILQWTAAEEVALIRAYLAWKAVANIEFHYPTSLYDADVLFIKRSNQFMNEFAGNTSPEKIILGAAYPPIGNYEPKWVYLNGDYVPRFGLDEGALGYVTALHEIGHLLGLAHPHDGGVNSDASRFPGVVNRGDLGDHNLNQGIFTTMTYNDGWKAQYPSHSDFTYGYQATPMALDIAAIQTIYGANTTHASGSDTYTLPSSNGSGTYWSCIWDTGGSDTITNEGSRTDCTINLNEAPLIGSNAGGYVSYASNIIGGFTIANGVTIENAIGGSGNDTLIGNSAANTLTGGAGNDILVSGGGSDFLSGGSGDDFALLSMAHRSATSVSSTRVTDSSQTVTMDSVEGKAFLDVELSGSFQSGALNCVDTTGDGRVDIIMETDSHQFYFASGSGSGSTGGLSTASVGLTHGGASGFIENQVQFYDVNGDGRYDSIFQGLDNRFWANFGTDSGFSGATLVGQHGGAFNTAQVQYADTNGDSKIDMIFQGTDNRFWVSTGEASGFSGASLAAEHGGPFNPDQVQYTDMNGDSKTDLIFQGTDNRFWANFGADSGFGGARLVAEHGGPFTAGQVQYADVNGDSKSDLIFQGVDNRFWVQLGQDNSFGGATLAATVTHDDFNINQWQLVDMNGDNAKDLMYQGDGNDVWYYLSNGDGTFASGQKVASFGGSFQRESIGYGDLNGDGLGDIIFQDANNDIWTSLQNHDWIT